MLFPGVRLKRAKQMHSVALLIHILGWSQWMGAHTALAGLLRRDALYQCEAGPTVAGQLNALFITIFIGIAMTLFGGIWLMKLNPGYVRLGLTKVFIALFLFFIAILPIRQAKFRLQEGGEPLSKIWFPLSLAGFTALVIIGVFKPI